MSTMLGDSVEELNMPNSSSASTSSNHIDNTNLKYKLPFAHGWKRELVYRNPKSDDPTTTSNKTNKKADVYYHSPENKQFRSLVQIKKTRKALKFPLTIDNFSFKKEAIGIDDPLKEIIRNAKSKSTKDDSSFKSGETRKPLHQSVNDFSMVSSPKRPKLDNMDNSINIKQRSSEINKSNMDNSLKYVFPYLGMKDRLTVTKVCPSWRNILADKYVWKYVCLKNVKISDWKTLIDFITEKESILLDIRDIVVPSNIDDYLKFWRYFSSVIINATKLKYLKINGCPIIVIHNVMRSLHQLEILDVHLIQHSHPLKCSYFDIDYVSKMINLTQLRIRNLTGLKLVHSPELTFSCLTKLKTLSLTYSSSIELVPANVCRLMGTISIDLEVLEIGDCECLPDDFPIWSEYAKEYFSAIRSLKKLKNLELVGIAFDQCVKEQLEQCDGITGLLIIPIYYYLGIANTNCDLFHCFEKLSKTLTHIIWGITEEVLDMGDVYIADNIKNQRSLGYIMGKPQTREPKNNVPISRSRKLQPQPEDPGREEEDFYSDEEDDVQILTVSFLQYWLNSIMLKAKCKVIRVPYTDDNEIYLSKQFNDL
ncbi:Methyl-CpG DNA binding,F-box domain,Leucine-rich repeat domain, L domain-like,DNA-binding domain [Cinara cedri]|uniref:Methyl-CpG DNA binding,F-box domain,Leucine-rich repeat domain, L domain-like,DNA-binding domain n=1 Tax=Cinara cedri TaxID=506608 RepID=A0A5E4MWR3_9HEMI|nr:Methyl-CpG DNA binding,F-box domain,Leucine-rich repeat domain, L domain-like,DNA-binding domain [Cinara cedri]